MTPWPDTWPSPPRAATPEDAEAIAGLLARCLPDPWPAALVDQGFRHAMRGLVLETDARISGVVLVQLAGPEAEILQVAVDPERRREGLGRRLVRAALALAAEAGAEEVFLEVRPGNAGARRLYEAEGFETVGRRAAYYSNGEDALLMRRSVRFPLPGPAAMT